MSLISPFFGSHPNLLLAKLTAIDLSLISPHLAVLKLKQRRVIHGAGDEVEHVYFPHDDMVSLLAVMQNGKAIETATVGREGVVGAMAGLGLYTSMVRAVVQLPMVTSRISAARFRHAVDVSKTIERTCTLVDGRMTPVRQSVRQTIVISCPRATYLKADHAPVDLHPGKLRTHHRRVGSICWDIGPVAGSGEPAFAAQPHRIHPSIHRRRH